MFNLFKRKKKSGCPNCYEQNTISFGTDYLEDNIISQIQLTDEIGGINIYQCQKCKTQFYINGNMYEKIFGGQIELLKKWNVLIILISIIVFSCSQKKNEIDRIEIMSYYYDLNESQTEFKIEPVTYSIIDENGIVETIQKTPLSKNEYLNFKSTIDRKLIDKISLNSKNKNEKFYNEKPQNPIVEISCSPIIRIKIKYKNQKEITFNSTDFKTNSRHYDFVELQNLIKKNYAEKKFTNIEDSSELEKKLKAFEKYSMNKDTLELPFPPMPMPNTNQIKFIKYN